LDDGLVVPLGSDKSRQVDIRLICASNVDLSEEVRKGTIREDFYHRIMVLAILVPPLRERTEDIPLLVSHFLCQAAERNSIPVPELPAEALEEMLTHSWPGNVRELKNAVERMVLSSHKGVAGPLVPNLHFASDRLLSLPATPGRLKDEMEAVERSVIETALRENRREINATYRALGISRRALYERMKKYRLDRGEFREP
jgi:two-component system C4-dicarboxylate transport response regulator DctD